MRRFSVLPFCVLDALFCPSRTLFNCQDRTSVDDHAIMACLTWNIREPSSFVFIDVCVDSNERSESIWNKCLSMTTILVDRPASSSYSSRSIKLFSFGCTLAVVLLTFQYEHKLRLFNSPSLMLTLPALSLISICGFGAGKKPISLPKCLSLSSPFIASALVGLLYPMILSTMNQASILDYQSQTIRKSQVCKSIVIFMGINHLCAVRSLESSHGDEIDIRAYFFSFLIRKFHFVVICILPWPWPSSASRFGGGSIEV